MPIVIHGTWIPNTDESFINTGSFFLWFETRSIDTDYPDIFHNPKKLFPYAYPTKNINELIKKLGLPINNAYKKTITSFLLPTYHGEPISSLAIKKYAERETEITLSDWSVPGIALNIDEAFLTLSSFSDFIGDPEELILGSDLIYWASVTSYVKSLVKSEQFLPDIVKSTSGNYYALWKFAGDPVAYEKSLSNFSSSMPGIAGSTSLGFNAHSLTEHFIAVTLDHLVRNLKTSKIIDMILRAFPEHVESEFIHALLDSKMQPINFHDDFKPFYKKFKKWLTYHQTAYDMPFRLCFKLEEPKDHDGNWVIRFLLQGRDDPSLIVPTDEIWQRGAQNSTLFKLCKNPREILLASLGKASEIYPPLLKSLEKDAPSQWELTSAEAYDFLKHGAGTLEENGYGILVPNWWKKDRAEKKVNVKLKLGSKEDHIPSMSTGLMGIDALIDYDIALAIGDKEISVEEWQRLVDIKVPLVNINGQWIEVRKDEIDNILNIWSQRKKQNHGKLRLSDAINLANAAVEEESIGQIETHGWFSDLMKKLEEPDSFNLHEQPQSFYGKLRDYQKRGMSWMMYLEKWGLSGCLADDMGLGKTIQILALLLKEKEEETAGIPTLLVCPTSVVRNWQREAYKFAPTLSLMIHYGQDRLKEKDFKKQALASDLVITSFGLARRDIKELQSINWKRVVVDEAQNIKNPTSKQTKAIKSIKAQTRIALTGTPVENRLAELWSIMDFLNPGYLGSFNSFRTKFELPIQKYNEKEPLEKLQKLVKPFILRRVKTDPLIIKDLPEKQETKVYCPLTREQASLYEAVVKDTLEKLDDAEGIERRGLILTTLIKLKQICNHPTHFLHDQSKLDGRSGKLIRLSEMLYEALLEGDSALVFTQFREMGELLRIYLDKIFDAEVMFLHGGVPITARDDMVQRFQKSKEPKIFILSLKAGGVGLNLTKANHVFHFDRWWNPAVENQATDRAFRIGQKKNVQVYKYICQGTLEERIDELIVKKQKLADYIIGSDEAWLTEMDNEQIADLITLSRKSALE
ncbi:DEAD/DEAH box helicase [Tepidanaerobacter acetatoxydans]|uniref:DEAD/DEAH box helicase n=1 Tax=Tepidanaerobacter acetatoxydans TaxID=499229 RepID=UPI001BD21EF3|nr:DEAD/DEAH box helicase [Tepidanaerobacter acetatoxydans]